MQIPFQELSPKRFVVVFFSYSPAELFLSLEFSSTFSVWFPLLGNYRKPFAGGKRKIETKGKTLRRISKEPKIKNREIVGSL